MSMKRPNGTGSVSLLKDGRYCVTFTDPDGKRIYHYRRNRKDAELELAKLIASDGKPATLAVRHSITQRVAQCQR